MIGKWASKNLSRVLGTYISCQSCLRWPFLPCSLTGYEWLWEDLEGGVSLKKLALEGCLMMTVSAVVQQVLF
jgi:hypothetical protein